jgi:hypothetical protein
MLPVLYTLLMFRVCESFRLHHGLVLIELAVLLTARKRNLHLFLWLNVDILKARVQVPVILDLGTR